MRSASFSHIIALRSQLLANFFDSLDKKCAALTQWGVCNVSKDPKDLMASQCATQGKRLAEAAVNGPYCLARLAKATDNHSIKVAFLYLFSIVMQYKEYSSICLYP